ncbi:Ankyrin repeat-containing protein [Ananas comosus]|uniref:Ankyrin repeat-containing protein n=1 Tax=Ananas comosus TaxID=4615 RepID=A0A199W2D2_ANACO|nr:Ankyrin repeat-containing protein [Ananas comosus]
MVCELLKHDTSSAYVPDANGLCPVHVASSWGRSDIVRELIGRCPDMDELVDNEGRNFLHVAVVHNRAEIVNFVCQRPLLVKMMNAEDSNGNTPLHLAVASENHRIMSLLLENKSVHPRIINKNGQTPLGHERRWHPKSPPPPNPSPPLPPPSPAPASRPPPPPPPRASSASSWESLPSLSPPRPEPPKRRRRRRRQPPQEPPKPEPERPKSAPPPPPKPGPEPPKPAPPPPPKPERPPAPRPRPLLPIEGGKANKR